MREEGVQSAGFAEGSGLAAEMLSSVDDESVKFVEELMIGRKAAPEKSAEVIVGMAWGSEPVALEDTTRVGINDEDGVATGI